MKKIVGIIAAVAMAASVFAADFAATLNMGAKVLSGDQTGKVDIITLDDIAFKDGKDLFSVSITGEKVGGSIGFGTASKSVQSLDIRSVKLWLQPIDQIKINWGTGLDEKLYCEHISYWRTPTYAGSMNADAGFSVEIMPVEAFRAVVSFSPDWGKSFATINNAFSYLQWSVMGKYTAEEFSVGAAYKDGGTNGNKVINIGGSYGKEYGGSFYGFVNAYLIADSGYNFNTAAIDNWFKFMPDVLTVSVRIPVVIGFTGKVSLDWEIKLDMPIADSGFTFYTKLGTGNVFDRATTLTDGWNFNNFVFTMSAQPGVTFNCGAAAMDVSFRIDILAGGAMKWQIPVTAKVSF